VSAIEPGLVRVGGCVIEADTIILAADIVPSPVAARIGVERDRRGGILTGATMRSVSHPAVWAIGDCAAILGPEGGPHPALAQHAIREGRAVARNVHAAVLGHRPRMLVYRSLGTMASFGHRSVAADIGVFHVTGFLAWWLRRTYYLLQMPRWGRRLHTALDWTVSLLFPPHLTKVDLAVGREREQSEAPRGAGSGGRPGSELAGVARNRACNADQPVVTVTTADYVEFTESNSAAAST
jgi:NADH dehydrogenase